MLKTTRQLQLFEKRPLVLGMWYYKEIADILDIHKSSKKVLCIRITDDVGFVEIVQINIYVQL
jgi:hypothetical protein